MNKKISFNKHRRKFLQEMGLTALSLPVLSMCDAPDPASNQTNMQAQHKGKLGIALVGLGQYASGQLAPALQQTRECYLAGIVTGTPAKADSWKRQYGIPGKNIYNYGNFDEIRDNPDIDIVYVVLPNALHADYTVRAARAGKHVICEKPMALSVGDCDRMIAACREAGKMLSIGYRLHFEPYNLEMKRLGQQKIFGEVKHIKAGFGFVAQPGIWRLDKKMAGGGPLQDLGIYCIQGACYIMGSEPIAVTAKEGVKHDTEKFKTVEESLSWEMEFADGTVASCRASYNDNMNVLHADAGKGWFELSPAFNYDGLQGKTSEGPMKFGRAVNRPGR
jgi:predicted dehydrogenase